MIYTKEDLLKLDRAAMEQSGSLFDQPVYAKDFTNRWAHRAVGAVLAGGQATRMGGLDKPFINISGKSLLDRCVDRLSIQADSVIVSANGDLNRFDTDLPVVADTFADFAGPLAGILSAMRWTQANAPHAFWVASVAVDTPFFPEDLVCRFVMAMGGPAPSVVLAQSGENIHPTFGLWPVALADDLEDFLKSGERKVRVWAEKHNCCHAVFGGIAIDDLDIDPFFNVNNREDIPVAEAIADSLAELTA
ncbi:molybdenum cofactor guanylyltransferase MobA [Cohaesibacter celericrescens]|uniref:molybdenum cofactor guanylyltransferase MobA n=1 Tax=Cohaesibacter celericrescens TaxID=2067669 RepID=UPI003561EAC3